MLSERLAEWSFIVLFLLSLFLGVFITYAIMMIKKDKKIEKFIMEKLNNADKFLYNKHIQDFQIQHPFVLCFLKSRLSERNFRELKQLTGIKKDVRKVTSTKEIYEIDGEVYRLPKVLEVKP